MVQIDHQFTYLSHPWDKDTSLYWTVPSLKRSSTCHRCSTCNLVSYVLGFPKTSPKLLLGFGRTPCSFMATIEHYCVITLTLVLKQYLLWTYGLHRAIPELDSATVHSILTYMRNNRLSESQRLAFGSGLAHLMNTSLVEFEHSVSYTREMTFSWPTWRLSSSSWQWVSTPGVHIDGFGLSVSSL